MFVVVEPLEEELSPDYNKAQFDTLRSLTGSSRGKPAQRPPPEGHYPSGQLGITRRHRLHDYSARSPSFQYRRKSSRLRLRIVRAEFDPSSPSPLLSSGLVF